MSCTETDSTLPTPVGEEMIVPIGFDSYVGRMKDTRAPYTYGIAGTPLPMSTTILHTTGFTVLAYHTYPGYTRDDGQDGAVTEAEAAADATLRVGQYAEGKSVANYMYNQHVTWNETQSLWEYEPLKYWPNDNDYADWRGARGSLGGNSYVSYFAFAPYSGTANQAPLINKDLVGIYSMTYDSEERYPYVRYHVSPDPRNGVDLMWATAPDAGLQYLNASTMGEDGVPGMTNVEGGAPLVNLLKPEVEQRLQMAFHHALARINIMVQAELDETLVKPEDTRILLHEVRISSTNLPMYGLFRLNQRKGHAVWERDEAGMRSVTDTDTRTETLSLVDNTETELWNEQLGVNMERAYEDGGSSIYQYNADPAHAANQLALSDRGDYVVYLQQWLKATQWQREQEQMSDPSVPDVDVNKDIFQWALPQGVTAQKQSMLTGDFGLLLIPYLLNGEKARFFFEIDYTVITRDEKLSRNNPKGHSIVRNRIKMQQPLMLDTDCFKPETQCNLLLKLGLTSAKLTLDEVVDWDTGTGTTPVDFGVVIEEWKLPEAVDIIPASGE